MNSVVIVGAFALNPEIVDDLMAIEGGIEAPVKHAKVDDDKFESLLGKMPDAEIARRFNVTANYVWLHRTRLGIPRYLKHGKLVPRKRKPVPYEHLLGKLPDTEIARRYGCTINAVNSSRTTRGIDRYYRKGPKKYSARNCPLGPELIQEIQRRLDAGENRRAIARDLKIGRSTLYRLLWGTHVSQRTQPPDYQI